MPPVSQAMRAAMGAAASGHSTLGIPQSVGKEFINADPGGKLPARVHNGTPIGPSAVEQHMGLPKGGKKVRRGGGRHKGQSAVAKHHADIAKHLAAGNPQQAKVSALHLANALHGMTKQRPGATAMPSDNDGDEMSGPSIGALG